MKLHGLEEEQGNLPWIRKPVGGREGVNSLCFSDRLRQAIASLKGEIERRKENPHLLSTTGMVGLWNEIAKPALSELGNIS